MESQDRGRAYARTFVALIVLAALACGGGDKSAATSTPAASPPAVATPAATPAAGPLVGAPPAGATAAMVAEGDSIFHGQKAGGLCITCHGADAKGTPLAPDLAAPKDKWLTGDGSWAMIQKRVTEGMATPTPPYTMPMLPMGGAQLTPDQIKSVSAYVYAISHK